jgi:hypothetical protein
MTDIETSTPKIFARRELVAISVVSILLIALALTYARSFGATTRFTTEVRLGSTGTGALFEPVATTLSRLQDDILEYAPEELLRNYKISELKSHVVFLPVDSGTVIRLRTVGAENDRTMVEAIHRYIADQVINRLLPLATAERNRLQSQIERVQGNLKAIDRLQGEYRSFKADNEKTQARLGELSRGLRNTIAGQAQQNPPSKEAPELAASYVLIRDIETLQIVTAPLYHAQSRFDDARLDRDKADLQADEKRWAQELSRWERPSIARFAVAGKGPFLSSLPGYLIMGVMAGTLFAFVLAWMFIRWRRMAARQQK